MVGLVSPLVLLIICINVLDDVCMLDALSIGWTQAPWGSIGCRQQSTAPSYPLAKQGDHPTPRERTNVSCVMSAGLTLNPVHRAFHPHLVYLGHMGVNHGGLDIDMPQQVLDRSDVAPVFHQMGSEGMTQGVDGYTLG